MRRTRQSMLWGMMMSATLLMYGCGGSSDGTLMGDMNGGAMDGGMGGGDMAENAASNIPYLRQNHANYSEYGSQATPAPVKDDAAMAIRWTVEAQSEEDARKLAEHIDFMDGRLKGGDIPRRFDKLFVAEAYMKYNGYYTTSVERNGNVVVIEKKANNACAYAVISAHSDAVSGDFFARGDIMQDYSSVAETILNTAACSAYKAGVEAYGGQGGM